MSIFHQQVEAARKRCKCCVASAFKAAFSICHSFGGKLPQAHDPTTAFDSDFDQEEEEIFVSAIINKYMESKSKRKFSNVGIYDSFYWAPSPEAEAGSHENGDVEDNAEVEELYFCGGSHVSRCSSSFDAFVTADTCFSRCSSLNNNIDDFFDFEKRRWMIMELINIHCKGWPFGLCRKALLLPPLPKSPTDSWLWTKTKSGRIN